MKQHESGKRHARAHGGDTKGKTFIDTIDLASVERGPHEELVASIAAQQGYYADEGVHVALCQSSRKRSLPGSSSSSKPVIYNFQWQPHQV